MYFYLKLKFHFVFIFIFIQDIEKQEEAKLQMRYPQAGKPMAGHSAFLAKRLTKGQKYFDSGDYQMAKQSGKVIKTKHINDIVLYIINVAFIR